MCVAVSKGRQCRSVAVSKGRSTSMCVAVSKGRSTVCVLQCLKVDNMCGCSV